MITINNVFYYSVCHTHAVNWRSLIKLVISSREVINFLVPFACPRVYVCEQDNWKIYRQISTKVCKWVVLGRGRTIWHWKWPVIRARAYKVQFPQQTCTLTENDGSYRVANLVQLILLRSLLLCTVNGLWTVLLCGARSSSCYDFWPKIKKDRKLWA